MSKFQAKLTTMFEAVEGEFRDATLKRFRTVAEQQYQGWLKRLEGPEPKTFYLGDLTQPPKYVSYKEEYLRTWEAKQAAARYGHYSIDYEKAERDANAQVDQAKLHFISKQTKKLETATTLCVGTPSLRGSLEFNGIVVTGVLRVAYGKSSFRLEMSMIVNNRHERGYIEFYQFPARFTDVVIGPLKFKTASQTFMSENFR